MNLAMEAAWNQVVGTDDLVYYLGDFAMNVRLVPFLLSKLNGTKILIPGNHDKCWQKTEPANRWLKYYVDAGFQSIQQTMTLEIVGQLVLLNHLPYRNLNEPDQKYFDARPVDHGGWLIHGHVHHHWKVSRKQINVSVDAWEFKPVAIETLVEIIINGPIGSEELANMETSADY